MSFFTFDAMLDLLTHKVGGSESGGQGGHVGIHCLITIPISSRVVVCECVHQVLNVTDEWAVYTTISDYVAQHSELTESQLKQLYETVRFPFLTVTQVRSSYSMVVGSKVRVLPR